MFSVRSFTSLRALLCLHLLLVTSCGDDGAGSEPGSDASFTKPSDDEPPQNDAGASSEEPANRPDAGNTDAELDAGGSNTQADSGATDSGLDDRDAASPGQQGDAQADAEPDAAKPRADSGSTPNLPIPAEPPTGNITLEQLPGEGAVGFILVDGDFQYFQLPEATSTSINHISPDGTLAYGWYRDVDGNDRGFQLELATGTFTPIRVPGTRFFIVRGGFGKQLVGKLADDQGTVDDPDDDVRKGFIYDTESEKLQVFERDGYTDIGFTSMNSAGVVTGFNDFGAQGFLFIDGEFIDLDDDGAYRLFPFQISDRGFVGFWGSDEETWFDSSVNPAFIGELTQGAPYAVHRYEFPGYSGTGLTGINNRGAIAGMAHPSAGSYPVIFSAEAAELLPEVYPLPAHLEPFVTGLDDRGWIYGQIFLHELVEEGSDPEAAAIVETIDRVRAAIQIVNGPAHSGAVSSVIHSEFHELDSPALRLADVAAGLPAEAVDRVANRESLQDTVVNGLWLDVRRVEQAAREMKQLVDESSASDSTDAATVYAALSELEAELPVLREQLSALAASVQEPVVDEYTGLGGPLNPSQLDDGNVLVALATDGRVVELTPSGDIAWSYPIGYPTDAVRLEDGNTLIASRDEGRAIELDTAGEIVWEYAAEAIYGVERLANGNTLLSIQGEPAQIAEVDASGVVVWQYGADDPALLAPSATRLSNGNTLVADNAGYFAGYANVLELGPDKEVAWEFNDNLFGIYGVARPEGETTFINDQGNGRLIEVSATGELLWSYGALHLPGGFDVVGDQMLIAVFGENRVFRIVRGE